MPTAARLFAAVLMAAVAWMASTLYGEVLPEGRPVGFLAPINAVLGLFVGWTGIGRLTDGTSYALALGHGIRGAVVFLFWALLIWSSWDMLVLSVQRRYDGVGEAVEAIFDLIAEYALLLLQDPLPGATLFAGAICAALVAEWGARRYR